MDAELFLETLRIHFEEGTKAQCAEGELLALTQRAWPVAEYVSEFRQVASKLQAWPEWLLVH